MNMETTLAPMTMQEQLGALLEIIFTIPWFAMHPKGAIFLVDPATGDLEMTAHRGMPPESLQKCRRLQPGMCFCGRVVSTGQTLFQDRMDAQHEIRHEGIAEHGHYCVPIHSSGRVIGVIHLYVSAGHVRKPEEEAFLGSVAITIAALVERKRLEERIQQQADFDALTGLPNRVLFHDRLSCAISLANRTKTEVVLMFMDLDHFKQVNDTMGHKVGDRLLQEAARRILTCVRTTDTVARLGGDEFTIILPKLTNLFYVEFVALRIIEEVSKPYHFPEGSASVGCSIGITVFPRDASDMDQLIKNADTAMYHAKDAGRASFRFFQEAMTAKAMERLEMEKALKAALEQDEFLVYYQPKVDPVAGRTVGMEALVRWQRPGVGLVAPSSFIPIAEQTGLIVPIGERVLRVACRQNKAWIDAGRSPMCVSVNLSTRQFRQGERLLATIQSVLEETELPPEYLELEITESMMMEDIDEVVRLLRQVQGLGIKISVDDFGTGYSSLSSLKNLPIQTLKIDRSFVVGLIEDQDSVVIVSAIIAMAKQLKLKVVAEGVENGDQLHFLKENRCDEIQGYFYARPMPPEGFEAFLDGRV